MNNIIGVIAGKSGDAITSELHKCGYDVALICGSNEEAGSDIADYVKICDLREKETIFDFFKNLNVGHVIIGTGHRYAIELADFLENKGIRLNIDLQAVKLCKNKYLTKELLKNAGLPVAAHVLIEDKSDLDMSLKKIEDNIGIPCVLKSIEDIKEPQLIFDKETLYSEIKDMLSHEKSIFAEEYKKGSDCTVIVANDGVNINPLKCVYWSKGSADRLKGFEQSQSYKLSEDVENELLSISKKAVEVVGTKGLVRVDFIVEDGDAPYILEINGIIVSGLRGTTYCTLIMQQKINRAEKIVESALRFFDMPCDKRMLIGYFKDSDNIEHSKPYKADRKKEFEIVDYRNLNSNDAKSIYPDLASDFSAFVYRESNGSIQGQELIWLLMFLIKRNFDYIINDLTGENKKHLSYIIKYLNLNEIGV